jgi:antitoxin HicB
MKAKLEHYAKGQPRKLSAHERGARYNVGSREEFSFTVRPLDTEDGGGFLIEFPDLPGCISDGDTIKQAIENGMDAKAAWLAVAREIGRAIPKSGAAMSGKWVQRVPKTLHSRLADRARIEGVSLNTLVVALLSEGLGKRVR